MLRTRSPLTFDPVALHESPFDLHVLTTPPAFILSQDQTLRKESSEPSDSRTTLRVRFLSHAFFCVKGLIGGPNQSHKVNLKEPLPLKGESFPLRQSAISPSILFPPNKEKCSEGTVSLAEDSSFAPFVSPGALKEGRGTMERGRLESSTFLPHFPLAPCPSPATPCIVLLPAGPRGPAPATPASPPLPPLAPSSRASGAVFVSMPPIQLSTAAGQRMLLDRVGGKERSTSPERDRASRCRGRIRGWYGHSRIGRRGRCSGWPSVPSVSGRDRRRRRAAGSHYKDENQQAP